MAEQKSKSHQDRCGYSRIHHTSDDAGPGALHRFVHCGERECVGEQSTQRENDEREAKRCDNSRRKTLPMPQGDEQSLASALKPVVAVAEEDGLHENSYERNHSEWNSSGGCSTKVIRSGKLSKTQHRQYRVAQKARNAQLAHRKEKHKHEGKHDSRSAEWKCDSTKNSRPSRYETSRLLEAAIDVGRRRKRQEQDDGKENRRKHEDAAAESEQPVGRACTDACHDASPTECNEIWRQHEWHCE